MIYLQRWYDHVQTLKSLYMQFEMIEHILSTNSIFLYEFLLLKNLHVNTVQYFFIIENTPTKSCKQQMKWQIEMKLLLCSYKRWSIKMTNEFWFFHCLIVAASSTFQPTNSCSMFHENLIQLYWWNHEFCKQILIIWRHNQTTRFHLHLILNLFRP